MHDVNAKKDPIGYKLFGWFLVVLGVLACIAFMVGAVAVVLAWAYRFAGIILIVGGLVWLCMWADKNAPKDET